MVLLLMIPTGLTVSGLFKEKIWDFSDWNNATNMDPSTSVCNIYNPKPFMRLVHFAWLKSSLAPVLNWGYWHGTVIDDTTRIYRLRTIWRNDRGFSDWNNATNMDPSTNACNVFNPKPFMRLVHSAWLKSGLVPVLNWGYWHGAAIDDTTWIYRLRTL